MSNYHKFVLFFPKNFRNAKLAFQTIESAIKNTTLSFLFLHLFCLFFMSMLDWYVPVLILLKTLDQGHLHSQLEVPGLTCPSRESNPGPPRWEASTPEKEPFEQLVNSYSEPIYKFYIWASDQWKTLWSLQRKLRKFLTPSDLDRRVRITWNTWDPQGDGWLSW